MDNHFFSTSAMEINEQPPDGFLNPNWDSALSSMVSSPAASNSSDSFAIRELIGKLGNIGSSAEISPHSRRLMGGAATFAAANGNSSTNTSSYSNSPPLNSTVAEFSADPGFAARAARFSCFGSRSFNGRTQLNLSQYRSTTPLMENGKLSRVSSSPSLKALVCSQMEGSTVSEQNPIEKNKNGNEPNSRKRKSASKGKGKESATTPSSKGIEADDDSNPKRCKLNGKENGSLKPEEEPLKDYIHVRARRGQATDSHSLAERVRREKISERMKLLQDLVPGCNKVTGKALMLDEIINYVQSLQRQVECLSMKLASVNTSTDLNMASLTSKDMFQSNNSPMQQPIFSLDSSAPAFFGHQNQAMPIHGTTSVDPMDSALCRNILGLQLPQLDGFGEGTTQTFCEDDLQSIVQMGFGQNPTTHDTAFMSQNVQGSSSTQLASPMKIEL